MAPKWFPLRDRVILSTARRRWLGYGVAVVSTVAAIFLVWVLEGSAPRVPLYPLFTLAIIASASAGGLWPGLLGLGLSLFYNVYFILLPHHWPPAQNSDDWLPFAAFVVVGLSVCVIVANPRRNISKRKHAEDKARARAAELRTIVDSMSEHVYVCETDARF